MDADEALSRVRRVRVPFRVLAEFLFRQRGLPRFVDFPDLGLPEGYSVVRVAVEEVPLRVTAVVHHPSFDPVPEGGEVPEYAPDIRWTRYALATPGEVAARNMAPPDLDTAGGE